MLCSLLKRKPFDDVSADADMTEILVLIYRLLTSIRLTFTTEEVNQNR